VRDAQITVVAFTVVGKIEATMPDEMDVTRFSQFEKRLLGGLQHESMLGITFTSVKIAYSSHSKWMGRNAEKAANMVQRFRGRPAPAPHVIEVKFHGKQVARPARRSSGLRGKPAVQPEFGNNPFYEDCSQVKKLCDYIREQAEQSQLRAFDDGQADVSAHLHIDAQFAFDKFINRTGLHGALGARCECGSPGGVIPAHECSTGATCTIEPFVLLAQQAADDEETEQDGGSDLEQVFTDQQKSVADGSVTTDMEKRMSDEVNMVTFCEGFVKDYVRYNLRKETPSEWPEYDRREFLQGAPIRTALNKTINLKLVEWMRKNHGKMMNRLSESRSGPARADKRPQRFPQ
jgi:hypothetical protein